MKKHLLALAALAAVSGAAVAQSVTVYGTVDTGLTQQNKYAAGIATSTTSATTAAATRSAPNTRKSRRNISRPSRPKSA